jgi:hypothetical protein
MQSCLINPTRQPKFSPFKILKQILRLFKGIILLTPYLPLSLVKKGLFLPLNKF